MGTSASSKGPGSQVSLIPAWIEAPPRAAGVVPGDIPPATPPIVQSSPIAPPRRFADARRHFGGFARTGSTHDLARGLGHYVRSGLGGLAHGTRRFGGTSRTAGALFDALQALRTGQAENLDPALTTSRLVGKSAHEIFEIVIEVVRPLDGTQDTDASRHALSDARADLFDTWPQIDLLALTEEQADFLVEGYVAHDVCRRIELDIGRNIVAKAPDPATAIQRLETLKSYVMEAVRASFRKLRGAGSIDRTAVRDMTTSAIKDTLDVFEDYLR